MTITREYPTVEDLASLLLKQEPEEKHDCAYYETLAHHFLTATEEHDDDTQ